MPAAEASPLSLGDVELAVASREERADRKNAIVSEEAQDTTLAALRTGSRMGGSTSQGGSARYSEGTPPTAKSRLGSPSTVGTALAMPTSSAGDLASVFAGCEAATRELELATRAAVSHREKCAIVLGAALAVNVALAEATAVSPALDTQTQTQLKRLCSGVLAALGLAVARVRVYGQYSRAQKIVRIFWYHATESKFEELRYDLEALEGQLWNLTGAVGGLGAGGTLNNGDRRSRPNERSGGRFFGSMKKLSVGPDRPRRMLRGGAAHWIVGGDVRVMCAAGVDGSELWWASNRSATLSAFDLFLESRRTVDDDTAAGGTSSAGHAAHKSKARCFGGCLGDVTAIAAEESSALLWTGTDWGGVATWDTDIARRWGGTALANSRGAAVTALTPVARGMAWAALADGSIVEVEAAETEEACAKVVRTFRDSGQRAGVESDARETNGGDGGEKRGKAKSRVKEMLRFGPIVWASTSDDNLETWNVETGVRVATSSYRDLGACVGICAHAAGGQIVTAHATGAAQTWWAADRVGERAETLAGPRPAGGLVVAAAVLEGLLCLGYRSGALKILPLAGSAGATLGGAVGTANWAPARIQAHRSGMVLLRAVDGGGQNTGIVTTGFFGSMIFWPLAELESAVRAAQPPPAREAPRRAESGTPPREHSNQGRPLSRDSVPGATPNDAGSSRSTETTDSGSIPPTPNALAATRSAGMASNASSSLGQNTALIPFREIQLKKCIGEGSFGRVYVAMWAGHTEVAVKMLGPPSSFAGREDPLEKQRGVRMAVGAVADRAGNTAAANNPDTLVAASDDSMTRSVEDAAAVEALDELEKEVGIMARLRHPNIVLLLGAVRSPPAIVEEFCARGSLFSVLQRHTKPGVPPLEWRVRLQMALGAAAGMCYLHNCSPPIIHRDLKSPNLMVDRYFRVKVGDFNLSRVAVASVGSKYAGMAERSGGGLHSPRWMAPEVLQSASYSRASDVYSFAVVLWELRVLEVPWANVGQWQLMHAVVEEGQRPPLDAPPAGAPTFPSIDLYDALIEDAWDQDPELRPAFEDVITRLQGLIDAHAAVVGARGEKARKGTIPKSATPTPPRSPLRASQESKAAAFANTAGKGMDASIDGNVIKVDEKENVAARATQASDVSRGLAPAEVGVDARDEAESAMTRILSRKRSIKLDAEGVSKTVTAATDAAVGELRASQEWASPTKSRPVSAAAAAATAAAAAAGAAVAAAEVEATLSKPRESSLAKPTFSKGSSLAKLHSFLALQGKPPRNTAGASGKNTAGASESAAPKKPPIRRARTDELRASADAVMQSPPGDGAGGSRSVLDLGDDADEVGDRGGLPPLPPRAAQSPMVRAIAARKTLEPLDLEAHLARSRATSGNAAHR